MSRNYVILEASEVSSIDFSQVCEDSPDTLGWNLDSSKTFVKYEGNKPRFLYGKTAYTHSEMLEILAGSDWSTPTP